jgi:hypothetical protein
MVKKTFGIVGMIAGCIWMPNAVCTKDVNTHEHQYPHNALTQDGQSVRSDLRTMALSITNDGDFQSCGFVPWDTHLKFERTRILGDGRTVTRTRWMPIDAFPSLADLIAGDDVLAEV